MKSPISLFRKEVSTIGLTDKQKKFAEEYIQDLNATRAYKVAYPKVKSEGAAASAGTRLLKNVKVREYIEKLLKEIKNSKIADAQEVMEYLTSVMRREHAEYVPIKITEEKTEYVPDLNGTMRKHSRKEETVQIVQVPAKLSDANKAAELLGKRYALFTDVNDGTDEALEKLDDILRSMRDEAYRQAE